MRWEWLLRVWGALAACLVLAAMPMPAHAQAGVAGRPLSVCVLRDRGGMNPAMLVRRPDLFDCTSTQYQLGPGSYWVISPEIGQRSRSREPLAVRFASLWQQGVTLHVLYADGTIRSIATDRRGVTPMIQLGAIVEIPLPKAQAKVVRLLWHVEGSANMRGILLGARLATADQSARANLALAGLYGAFAGLCIALIVYNLALWGALRHRFQLYYCAMVAGLFVYTVSSSGALAWIFPEIANNDRLRINYLLLGVTAGAAIVFARSFFEERVFAGWLGRYAGAVSMLLAGVGILFFVTAPFDVRTVDAVFTLTFLSLASVVGPTLWRAWRMRSNYLWLFALGWGAPILTSLLRMLSSFHIVEASFWLDNSTLVSMTAEALMSAVAIAYRMKLLTQERDEAVIREVLARRLADTDPLTGLLNRRAFLRQAIGRSGEQQLLIADIDHFKGVNDTLGHDGGDEVLRNFSRMLRSIVPANALVARIGGEEFAILTDVHEAVEPEAVLDKLRAARMPFDLKVTASIGACSGPLNSDIDWKALYRGADAALFEAKSSGRDRARETGRRAA